MSLPRGQHLYLDCFAGLAGDMFLGAALDLGVPEDLIREGLLKLPWRGYRLEVRRSRRMGIEGCDLRVLVDGPASETAHGTVESPGDGPTVTPRAGSLAIGDSGHAHAHDHGPPHAHGGTHGVSGHRLFREIREGIAGSRLPSGVRERALDIFGRIARAEARLHGTREDEVAFHEVGALDSIVDIVGAALVLEHLSPARVTSRTIPLGHGQVRTQHGPLPVPSPAALCILEGAAIEDGGAAMELCTPTGAAIAASCVQAYGPMPSGRLLAVGYGAGDAHLPDRPNHLRLMLFEPDHARAASEVVQMEANLDSMTGEWGGHLMEQLLEAGARDAWFTPIFMKKGRPAFKVSLLCDSAQVEAMGSLLLRESTTIGLRHHVVQRRVLARRIVTVDTPYGEVPMKLADEGGDLCNVAPEYEACRALARAAGVPLKEIYQAAMAAFRDRTQEGSP